MKPYYEDTKAGIVIYHGDCREILPEIGKVDLVLTDPPYSARTHNGARTNKTQFAEASYKQGPAELVTFESFSDSEFIAFSKQCLSVCRRWIIMTCDHRHAALTFDWQEHVRLGAWIKIAPMPQVTGDRPGCGHESILILHNPGRKHWNGGGKPALWSYPVEKGHTVYPTQKPLGLITTLLADFSTPSEMVLDPCMGSGTTLRAAKDLHLRAIGIDISEQACEIAAQRLSQEVLAL